MEYIYQTPNMQNQAQIASENDCNSGADAALSIALENEKVVGARCFYIGDTYIVAVLTMPIYLKSERDNCRIELQNAIAQSTGKNAVVTFDIDVYAKIKPDMPDEQKAALYKKVTSRT